MTTRDYILTTIGSERHKLAHYGIRKVGLFGSYARNEQSPESDIDILIDFEPDQENYDNYMAVSDMLEQLFKGYRVEIVTRNGLSPYIGPNILNEVLYV
jgi:predicted nucleotidyltransferase